jgi:nucleoside-diphosphate-sugar epimerase
MIDRKSKILVTGGTGFTGGYVLRALQTAGFSKITVLSRSAAKNPIDGVEYVSGIDICDEVAITPYLLDCEVVINLAGLVSFYKKDAVKLIEINANAVRMMMKICESNTNLKRFVHISSTAALGFGERTINEQTEFDWNTAKDQLPYSYSKSVANPVVDSSSVPTNILYPPLILGAGEKDSIKRIFNYARKKVMIIPPGKNSFIAVEDFARAIVFVLENASPNQNYLVTNHTYTFEELFKTAADVVKNKPIILQLPRWLQKPLTALANLLEKMRVRLPGENIFLGFQNRSHSSKKLSELGFSPRYSLKETLERAAQSINR